MRRFFWLSLALFPALLLAQGPDDESIKALLKKLASANSAERQEATEMLKARPEGAPLVREALRSPDREVARRAALILDHFDGRPVRELNAAIKDGEVEKAIKLVADWPQGKNDDEVFAAIKELGRTLTDLARKQGGVKINGRPWFKTVNPPPVIRAARITENTRTPNKRASYFLRAGEVDFDTARLKPGGLPGIYFVSTIVASGSVRFYADPSAGLSAVFAGGAIETYGLGEGLIVGCGDVTLEGDRDRCLVIARGNVTLKRSVDNSLIIAWGKVTCREHLLDSRIISGKSVVHNPKLTRDSKITQNEATPLGYIRWSDAPRPKAETPKKTDAPK
jgi:hypothetical protein